MCEKENNKNLLLLCCFALGIESFLEIFIQVLGYFHDAGFLIYLNAWQTKAYLKTPS